MPEMIMSHELAHVAYFVAGVIISGIMSAISFVIHQRTITRSIKNMSSGQVRM